MYVCEFNIIGKEKEDQINKFTRVRPTKPWKCKMPTRYVLTKTKGKKMYPV